MTATGEGGGVVGQCRARETRRKLYQNGCLKSNPAACAPRAGAGCRGDVGGPRGTLSAAAGVRRPPEHREAARTADGNRRRMALSLPGAAACTGFKVALKARGGAVCGSADRIPPRRTRHNVCFSATAGVAPSAAGAHARGGRQTWALKNAHTQKPAAEKARLTGVALDAGLQAVVAAPDWFAR